MSGYNPWPHQLPGFEEHFSSYYRRLRGFCRIMARSVALSLDLPEDFFQKYLTHPGCSSLIAHYPPQPPGSTLAKGLDAHTDAECKSSFRFSPQKKSYSSIYADKLSVFTVLAPGTVRALEVMNRDGQWISAPPRPGCFIVNVGDQLQSWTNDLYVSTRHRVQNFSGEERYSIPFFFSANFETVIEPIPELVGDGKAAKHSPLTAGKVSNILCDVEWVG
jgi:isopenicillin N synthase-like dioxygenase